MVAQINIDGYDLFRGDRPAGHKRGGVVIYVNSCLIRFNPDTKISYQEWCKVILKESCEHLVGVCYRLENRKIIGTENNI